MNQENPTKECTSCHKTKPLTDFYKNKTEKDGFQHECKLCVKPYFQIYYKNNKSLYNQRSKLDYINNKETRQKQHQQWILDHPEQSKKLKQLAAVKNKTKRNNTHKKRYQTDITYRLIYGCRNQQRKKLKTKNYHTIESLGCSVNEDKQYIESQFYNNMTWDKQGVGYGHWQIHHICPLEFFNMNDSIEKKQAFHYSNTKPLWYEDHVEEHRKINKRMSIIQ